MSDSTDDLRALVRISVALGRGDPARIERELRDARAIASAESIEEVLLQSYLFLGYPACLNAFASWRRLSPVAASPPVTDRWSEWVRRGQAVCERVYGGQYDRLRDNIRKLHPDMERWMVAEGYGKVLGRPGLSLLRRELCIAALLAAMRAEPQLYAHLRGALNAGASHAQVEEVLSWIGDLLPPERRSIARKVWEEVGGRSGERRPVSRGGADVR